MSYRTVSVDIYWKDEPDLLHPVRITVGEWDGSLDDGIFFYVKDDVALAELYKPDNAEEFVISN
jgi:hypothetical protein